MDRFNLRVARRLFVELSRPRTPTPHTPAEFRAMHQNYRTAEPADDDDATLDQMLEDTLNDE